MMNEEPAHPGAASVEAIFNTALGLPPGERDAYLAGACGGNLPLRQRVEVLLRAHEAAGKFLPENPGGRPGSLAAGVSAALPVTEKPGDRIGRYKLLQQIGEGGCGVVYMAEQEEPVRRRVALKVIKLGMDTKSVIARFEAERQALALMDHPNIAKVLDAGATETGRPYFVMELVRGIKITDYCDQNDLSTRDRLDLFVQVCHAIQHAHQKGIIHRDIKPSNILVTVNDGVAMPMVIDFGIAKATDQMRLTDKTLFTAFEQFIGTPAYMSPEQTTMTTRDIDTRSDIYALGVLLYELLTGKPPFDPQTLLAAGLDEMRRIIREQEPVRPSTRLRRTHSARPASPKASLASRLSPLATDLDWIVMKCLEKDRQRRYETANGLALDIDRHLKHEPVAARPPSTVYRVQKFVRRNKMMVAAATVVASALVLGITVSVWQAMIADSARLRAVQSEAVAVEAKEEVARERDLAVKAQVDEATQRQRAEAAQVEAEQERGKAVIALAESELERYYSSVAVAQQQIQDDNVHKAVETLLATPEPHRHWEWGHLMFLCHQAILTIEAKPEGTNQAVRQEDHPVGRAFSPDNRRLIAVTRGGRAELWDIARGEMVGTFETNAVDFWSVGGGVVWDANEHWLGFSPSGDRLAVVRRDKTLKLCDAHTLAPLYTIGDSDHPIQSFVFSPDGRRLATTTFEGTNTARIWDAEAGKLLARLEDEGGAPWFVKYSFDGRRIIPERLNYAGRFTVWDAETGRREKTFHPPGVAFGATMDQACRYLAYSDQNNFLIVSNVIDGVEWFRHPNPPTLLWRIQTIGTVDRGQQLLLFGGYPALWDLDARRPLDWSSDGLGNYFFDGRFRRLVSWKTGSRSAKVWEWDGRKRTELVTLRSHDGYVNFAAISPDGSLAATTGDEGTVKVWKTDPILHTKVPRADSWALALSPDGRQIAGAEIRSRRIGLYAADSGRWLRPLGYHLQWPFDVAFHPDGQRVASAGADQCIRIWRVSDGSELLRLSGHTATVVGVAFTPDGRHLASASLDRTTRVWDAETAEPLRVFWGETIGGQLMHPGGGLAIKGGLTSPVTLRDPLSGREVSPALEQSGTVGSLAFSKDGSIAAGNSSDRKIRLWDIASGRLLRELRIRTHVVSMAFSPDGTRLAVACAEPDRGRGFPSIEFWDTEHARLVLTLPVPSIEEVAFKPDGSRVVYAGRGLDFLETLPWRASELAGSDSKISVEALENRARDYWRQRLQSDARYPNPDAPERRPEAWRPSRSEWPRRERALSPALIDLTEHYTGLLAVRPELVTWTAWIDLNPVASFPTGLVTVGHARFDVRGRVQLARRRSGEMALLPLEVSGIRLGRKAQHLHFLHAGILSDTRATWNYVLGTQVALYRVTYADGQQIEVPIIADRNLPLRRNQIPWRLPEEMAANGALFTWENPRPEVELTSVDVVLQGVPLPNHPGVGVTSDSQVALCLFALSASTGPIPEISHHPTNVTVARGEPARFMVEMKHDGPWTYQWRRNGRDLPGATNATLMIPLAQPADAGAYSVSVQPSPADPALEAVSQMAQLMVRSEGVVQGGLWQATFHSLDRESLTNLATLERLPVPPSVSEVVPQFEVLADLFEFNTNAAPLRPIVVRHSGYLVPPATGDYVFHLRADDEGLLWLSPDNDPGNKRIVARESRWHRMRNWTAPSENQEHVSKPVTLEAGRRYYVEAWLKQMGGMGHLSVTWQLPGEPPPVDGAPPIPGTYLASPEALSP
jgi:WD40 repeat protein